MAFATAAEQETIKAAVEKLGSTTKPEQAPQFEVYRLSKMDPTSILPLVRNLFPSAKVTADSPTRSLIVIAPLPDQKSIKALLDQLQPEKPGPDTPELRFYPVVHLPTTELIAALQKVAPTSQVTADPARKRVMAVATPGERERIKTTLEQFEKNTPTYERNKLVVYPVTPNQRKRFELVLSKFVAEVPGIQVLPDTEPGELAVWTKAEQHKVIEELLQQFKSESPDVEKNTLVAYPLAEADVKSALNLLKKLHPAVQVVEDEKSHRLLVWAHPSEHASIKATLGQIEAPVPTDQQPRFERYPIRGTEPSTLLVNLRSLVPTARLTYDAKAGMLVAWGTAQDHELLKGALSKLNRGGGDTLENAAAGRGLSAHDGRFDDDGFLAAKPRTRCQGEHRPADEEPDRGRRARRPENDQGPDRAVAARKTGSQYAATTRSLPVAQRGCLDPFHAPHHAGAQCQGFGRERHRPIAGLGNARRAGVGQGGDREADGGGDPRGHASVGGLQAGARTFRRRS